MYNLNEVITYLDNNQQLNGINYNNFNDNYIKLSQHLNENQKNYINKIKQMELEKINYFNENGNFPSINNINGNYNLKYIDNFVLIDEEFAQYLFQMFNQSLTFYQVNYIKNSK